MKNAWLIVLLLSNAVLVAEVKKEEPVNDPAFHEKLLEIAKNYPQYGRVDDDARWAPWLCKPPQPSKPRLSQSKDDVTHGQKLYFLFARHREAYVELNTSKREGAPQATPIFPKDQIVVKESWTPIELAPGEAAPKAISHTLDLTAEVEIASMDPRVEATETAVKPKSVPDFYVPATDVNGKKFKIGEKKGLFIMYKTSEETLGTDKGWVYGTVTSDGKTVTSSGMVQSCRKCHESAPHERLFGLASERMPVFKLDKPLP